jgi:hypothetical protein
MITVVLGVLNMHWLAMRQPHVSDSNLKIHIDIAQYEMNLRVSKSEYGKVTTTMLCRSGAKAQRNGTCVAIRIGTEILFLNNARNRRRTAAGGETLSELQLHAKRVDVLYAVPHERSCYITFTSAKQL